MIHLITGDGLGEEYEKELRSYIQEADSFDFEEVEKHSIEYINKFFDVDDTKELIFCCLSPYGDTITKAQILELCVLENLQNKKVVIFDPMNFVHPYYKRKFAKKVCELCSKNKHNFTIVTNDINIITEIRLCVKDKILNPTDVKTTFYWKNEKIDLKMHESGCYQDYPDYFYDHDYVDQLTRFLE